MAIEQDFVVRSGLIAQGQTQSTSTATGTLIVGGGAGIGGNANIGGTILARINPNVTTSINTTTGFGFRLGDIVVSDTAVSSSNFSVANYIGRTTIDAGTGTVITTAVNVLISGAPISANSNTTITDSWSLYVTTGSVYIGETEGNPNSASGNALQVEGGASFGNGLFVQGGGNLEGAFYLNGAEVLTRANQNTGTQYFTAEVIIDTSTQAISTLTGALVIRRGGGLGVGGNIWAGGYFVGQSTGVFRSTQDAVSTSSGALRVYGGLAVGATIYARDEFLVSGNASTTGVAGNSLQITNGGGIGVSGTVYIGDTGDSALTVAGGVDVGGAIFSDQITLLNNNSATGYLAAPLMVTGGGYIGANLIVASTESYSLQVLGGATVDKDLTVKGIGSFTNRIEVANTSYVAGSEIITTGTVNIYAVTSLTAGTDTAVNTATGAVVVWNTSTLQTITDRGNVTTNPLDILNNVSADSLNVRGDSTFTGLVRLVNTESAYSTLTGALVVSGGVAIQDALYVFKPSYVSGAQVVTTATLGNFGVTGLLAGTDTSINTTTGVVTIWNDSTLQSVTDRGNVTTNQIVIDNITTSTTSDTGALVVRGGIGIGNNLTVGGRADLGGDLAVTGLVQFNNTRNSSTSTDGAVTFAGGVGIAQDLWVGGEFFYSGAFQVAGTLTSIGSLFISSAEQSTSTTTGAIVAVGGLGIGGNGYIGGDLYVNGSSVITTSTIGSYGVGQLVAGTDTAVSSSTGVVVVWNTSTLQTVTDRGQTTTNSVSILNTLTVTDVEVTNDVRITGNATVGAFTATGIVDLQNVQDSINVYSGAVRIAGGVGVQGNIYANAIYDLDSRVVTTSTINQFAVSSLTAGTDTVVSTSTGDVVIWNRSTLESVTSRGSTTTSRITIVNTNSEALTVFGGARFGNTVFADNDLAVANSIFATTASFTGTSFLNDVSITGLVTSTNTTQSISTESGSVVLAGGLGVGGSIYADAMYDQGARVVTTATIGDLGVSALYAGTDTAVNANLGTITVWNTSTLQSVSDRGQTTTNAISILNTLTVTDVVVDNNLSVVNSATVGSLYAESKSFVIGAEIITTATIANFGVTKLTAGTDTVITTSTGEVSIWSDSTLQSVTQRGSTTDQSIRITSTAPSGSYSEGALVVDGGVGVAGNLYVGQNALITGNLVVLGTQTIVDSTSTAIVDPVLDIGTAINQGTIGFDDLLNKGISVHYFNTGTATEDNMFFGRDEPSGKFIVKHEYGAGRVLNPDYSTSGTYAGAILGNLYLTDATSATSTYTGAFHVVGGGSVEGDFWIGGTAYIANAQILTTATIGGFGVTNIQGGVDISVNTATGNVIIDNTSTLQTVTGRGNSTTNAIIVNNLTGSIDTLSGALVVGGGVGIGENLYVGNDASIGYDLTVNGNLDVKSTATVTYDLFANQVFDNHNRVVTAVVPVGSSAIEISDVISTGTYTTFTVKNAGVLEVQGSDYISVTTSTGTVQIINLGVQTLTAGTDTAVSANTGTITVWNTSTFQSVTDRGNTTTNSITITSLAASSNYTSGALTVAGGVGIGGNVYINNKSFIENAEIVTTATIDQFAVTDLRAGTDTAVSAAQGIVYVWNTSTLQTITNRGQTTTNAINFANTTNSISLTTASVVVDGGLSVGKDLRIGGTFFYAGELQISSTTSSTSTDTGALTVVGGVGIGENLNVGGQVKLYNTASGTDTAALFVAGGVTVVNTSYFGDIYSKGSVVLTDATFKGVADITAGTDTAVSTQTGHVVIWNTSTLQTITDRGNSTTNAIHIANATVATDSLTGALVIDGGLGLGGNLYGQNIYVNNSLNAVTGDLALNAPGTILANGVDLLAYDGHVIYVSDNTGDDTTGDGRRVQSAYATLGKALSVATTGDIVFVEAGTYSEIFPLIVPQGVTVKGAGLRAVIITPTAGTNQNDAFLLNGETNLCDFTITGFYKPGWAFKFAPGAKISTKSPYIERVSIITRGTSQTSADPYGYNAGDAGNGAYLDAGVLDPTSLEPAMLWNEVTFIVPNATGMYMTNGARAELLNGFFYFANKAIDAQAGTTGYGGVGKTRLRLANITTGTFVGGDTLVYKDPAGTILAAGTIYSASNGYIYLNGPVHGFETALDRTAKTVTVYGGAKLSTVQKKYGTASLLISSTTTDYVEVLSDTDTQFNATDSYTVEAYVYPLASTVGNQYFFYKGTTSTNTIRMFIDNANKVNAQHGSTIITSTATIASSTWTHVALVRTGSSGAVELFVNGVSVASAPAILNGVNNTDPINIGGHGSEGMLGYIDSLRISNIARYTTTFTPDNPVNDSATVLMLHMNGANNSTSVVDDGITIQNIYSTGLNPAAAQQIILADYHQFGAELRCIGSAAVFGNKGVIANGTGTDLKLIAFNMSHIGSLGDLTDDVSLTVQSNEITQTNGGHIYYQTVDQNGDFRVGDHFLVNQRTGDVTFNQGALNLNNISSLSITDGVNSTVITPGNIAVGNVNLAGNTIGSLTGNLTIAPASTLTTIDSNLTVTGSANISQTSFIAGSQILTVGTIGQFGVTTITAGTDTVVTTSTGNVIIWNTSTLQSITDRGNVTTNQLNIANPTQSTSTTTGAITVEGGIGVRGDIRVGGNVYSQGGQPLYSPKVTVSLTAPNTATNNIGDFWIDPSIGVEYQWILDGENYYWIQFTGV
jgi:hypothetical protein